MAMPPAVVWVLTVTFTLTGSYGLARCGHFIQAGLKHPVSAWATELAHLAMSAAMVGMLWTSRSWDRRDIQLTTFAILAGWFAVRTLVGPPTGRPHLSNAGRTALLHETVAFAAMCWMSLRIVGPAATTTMGSQTTAMTSMPGPGAAPTLATTVSAGLATALTVGAVGWTQQFGQEIGGSRTGPPLDAIFGPAGEAACQVAMAVGMATALVGTL